jgi:(p)ppGpp synthase/HD superfamily hydrolase
MRKNRRLNAFAALSAKGNSMIYTKTTKIAMKIAFAAHKGQVDKAGVPYIFHPFHLAMQMSDEASVCVALLHDVVEDTEVTFEEMAAQGMPEEVIDTLRLLAHNDAIPYMDYIRRIKESGNKTAISVKLADLAHNSDTSRLDDIDEKARARLERYRNAMKLLNE